MVDKTVPLSPQITNCEVRGRLVGLDGVRATLRVLRVEGGLPDLGSLLLGGERLVWDASGKTPQGPLWARLEQAHFGHNAIERIDPVVVSGKTSISLRCCSRHCQHRFTTFLFHVLVRIVQPVAVLSHLSC